MKKLTEDELKEFNEARIAYFDAKSDLADVTIQLERYKSRKTTLLMDVDLYEDRLRKIQDDIHEKYGDVKVNFSTGELH